MNKVYCNNKLVYNCIYNKTVHCSNNLFFLSFHAWLWFFFNTNALTTKISMTLRTSLMQWSSFHCHPKNRKKITEHKKDLQAAKWIWPCISVFIPHVNKIATNPLMSTSIIQLTRKFITWCSIQIQTCPNFHQLSIFSGFVCFISSVSLIIQ